MKKTLAQHIGPLLTPGGRSRLRPKARVITLRYEEVKDWEKMGELVNDSETFAMHDGEECFTLEMLS